MAMTQGLASIDDGIKAFGKLRTAITVATASMSGLKKAMISTGIGALIVAVGTLIAYWDDVTKALGFYNDEAERSKALLEEQKNAVDGLTDVIAKQRKLAKLNDEDELATEQKILEQYEERLKAEQKRLKYYQGIINTGRKLTEQQQESYNITIKNESRLNDLILDQKIKIKDLNEKQKEVKEVQKEIVVEDKRQIDIYEELIRKIEQYQEEEAKGYLHTKKEQEEYTKWLDEEYKLKQKIFDVNWLLQKRAEEYAEANKEFVGELKNDLQMLAETKVEPIDIKTSWISSGIKPVVEDVEKVGKTTYETYSGIVA